MTLIHTVYRHMMCHKYRQYVIRVEIFFFSQVSHCQYIYGHGQYITLITNVMSIKIENIHQLSTDCIVINEMKIQLTDLVTSILFFIFLHNIANETVHKIIRAPQ